MQETNELPENDQQSLIAYIAKCKQRLNGLLTAIGWTEADVLKNFNTNSVAAAKDDKNSTRPTQNEPAFPTSCCRNDAHIVVLGQTELRSIVNDWTAEIPQKFSDLQVNFNREQKLAIYEHVTKTTGRLTEPERQFGGAGEQTLAEIVAIKKKEKKKRRRYRRSKPTFIEEVRAVVDLQMQAMQQFLGNKVKYADHRSTKQNRKDAVFEHKRQRWKSRSSSNDRSHERSYKRDSSTNCNRYDSRRSYIERYDKHKPPNHHKHKSDRRASPTRNKSDYKTKRSRSRSRSRTSKRHNERTRSRSYSRSRKYKRKKHRSRSRSRSSSKSYREHRRNRHKCS